MLFQDSKTVNDQTGIPTRAADKVVAVLEERIYSGTLAKGQMIPAARELIDEFSISKTVAREAVNILSGKGLIEARPGYRPTVRIPEYGAVTDVVGGLVKHLLQQAGGVRQIFEVRIFIEASLVRQAATDATKDDIRNLREALALNESCINNSSEFYETDQAFHAVFYTIPRNPIFPAIHQAFFDWLDDHWKQMPRLPKRNERNFLAHKAILDAVVDRDPDAAEQSLKAHLADAWSQVESTFTSI